MFITKSRHIYWTNQRSDLFIFPFTLFLNVKQTGWLLKLICFWWNAFVFMEGCDLSNKYFIKGVHNNWGFSLLPLKSAKWQNYLVMRSQKSLNFFVIIINLLPTCSENNLWRKRKYIFTFQLILHWHCVPDPPTAWLSRSSRCQALRDTVKVKKRKGENDHS